MFYRVKKHDIVLSKNAPVAQLDRALPSEGKGRTFESYRVHQLYEKNFLREKIFFNKS